jgi:TRAP transporter TAXI family solute receptor
MPGTHTVSRPPAIHLKAAAGGAGGSWYVNLTLNHLHCCVEQALPLPSVAAWMQHQYPLRLPVDRVGTVDRLVFQQLLANFGVSESTVEGWGGALIPAMNYDEQLALYARSEVNTLWQFMGIPSPSIQAAHALRPLKILPFPPGFVAELEQVGWTAAVMPAGAYDPDGQSGPTVAMATSLGFHVSVAEDVVHAITSVICDGADRVRQIHPAARHFAAARAHLGGHGPLHPGAARYFQEKGMPATDV